MSEILQSDAEKQLKLFQDALEQGSVPTPRHPPLKDKRYIQVIQELSKRAVFSYWNQLRRPCYIGEIRQIVHHRIDQMEKWNQWPRDWQHPGNNTIERRINELADGKYWEKRGVNVTPLIGVGVGNGYYMPNPLLFEGEIVQELLRMKEIYKTVRPPPLRS